MMARSSISTPSSTQLHPPPRGSSSGMWPHARGGWKRPVPQRWWRARASCAFQAYKHLKSLGYIVGRYGVPWTMKNSGTCDTTVPPSVVHTDQSFNRVDGTCSNITKLLKEMHIDEISPSFEVYLPNSKFKKSSPGAPSFLLCLLRNKPPSRIELEMVEKNFGGIPLKYCHVDNGRVSFLSFDKVALPRLP
ncbi:hypothetical protein GQ55_5G239800 [Panicum hallii var. hallii]|uniref:Uncharacterized protein n=1 Tax=Panicum hallii var. hallii TaxID=1504633 RepID=A0A2T7DJN3_9POAL|nr:hypothetical protein GQ55_5G239800 [Panicum hallii var. hallii]